MNALIFDNKPSKSLEDGIRLIRQTFSVRFTVMSITEIETKRLTRIYVSSRLGS